METMRLDIALIKSKVERTQADIGEIMRILLHAEKSLVSRTYIIEEKIAHFEKNAWHMKTALYGGILGVIGFLLNLAFVYYQAH